MDASSRHSALLPVLTELEGGWTLEQLIGLGGSAAVYRGRRADGCVGAVKVMHSHLALDAGWLRRFKRETALLLQNPCSGVARLLEVGPPAGPPFFVMELLVGQSLEATRVARGGTLPAGEALACADSVLQVLSLMHRVGVVHRDLKPSNLFRTEQGEIKVLDFGIASATSSELSSGICHTTTRGILGTPVFMSPEQARGRWDLVDGRSDLWSLGATLFTLLSGETVHLGGTDNERLGLAMTKQARSLRQLLPRLHPQVIQLVDRALAYDPRDRFQSAAEFRRSLKDALLNLHLVPESSAVVTVREPSALGLRPARRKGWGAVATVAAVAAAVAAAVGMLGAEPLWQDGGLTRHIPLEARPSRRPVEATPAAIEPRTTEAVRPPTPNTSPIGAGPRPTSGKARRTEPTVRQTAGGITTAEPLRQPLDERFISRVEVRGSELLERRE